VIEKERLIVGVDDSNHAGDDRVKGEIDFATFSYRSSDAEIAKFPNRRNYQGFLDWISNEGRDYRFMLLKSNKFRHRLNNLIVAAPLLVEKFIEENHLLVESLEVYLDGILKLNEKAQLIHDLQKRTGIENIISKGFVKKQKVESNTIKRYLCPEVVYRADTGANMFFTKPFKELVSDPKYIGFL